MSNLTCFDLEGNYRSLEVNSWTGLNVGWNSNVSVESVRNTLCLFRVELHRLLLANIIQCDMARGASFLRNSNMLSGTRVLTFNSKWFSYSQEFAVCVYGHLVVQQSLIHDEGI